MSKLTRTLIIGATLAAMHLVGMTAVAQAQADDEPVRQPPTERQVGESWRHRQAASPDQTAADAALQRQLARERFSIPNATPAEVPAPVAPKPSRPSGWLFASLGVLVAALGLAGGLAVRAARRTRRRARLEHAASAPSCHAMGLPRPPCGPITNPYARHQPLQTRHRTTDSRDTSTSARQPSGHCWGVVPLLLYPTARR